MLSDSIKPEHAPVPGNDSERLLFAHLSETLVRLDCRGQLRSGLASQWIRDAARRQWIFTLRDGQQGGSTAEAAAIVSGWRARPGALQALGIEDVRVGDQNRIVVTLRGVPDSQPLLFADPTLAIVHIATNQFWPADRFILQKDPVGPVIEFRVEPESDPRDALDREADLLVTRDPELIEYASTQAAVSAFPLPWSRTYLLLQGPGSDSHRSAVATGSAQISLARDAVRAEARAAEPPYWWETVDCRNLRHEARAATNSSRIVYPGRDPVARGLAERIVALAGSDARLRATALSDSGFTAALQAGTEGAYVVPAPRTSLAPCRDSSTWPAGFRVTPLIDTRAHAIVRRGSPSLLVEWDGTVRVVP